MLTKTKDFDKFEGIWCDSNPEGCNDNCNYKKKCNMKISYVYHEKLENLYATRTWFYGEFSSHKRLMMRLDKTREENKEDWEYHKQKCECLWKDLKALEEYENELESQIEKEKLKMRR